jgi:DNA-binding IclR family transcriptional regulator
MSNAPQRKKVSSGKGSPLFVKSLEKAMNVLQSFDRGDAFQTLQQIAESSHIDKSTAQRLSYTLRELGFLEQCPVTRRYRIGRKALDLTFNYLRNDPLVERATPILIDLARTTNERVDLSIMDGTDIVYVARFQSKRQTFATTLIGRRVPAFCTAGGRSMLAHMDDDQVREFIGRSKLTPLTQFTIIEPEAIFQRVTLARRRGYAVNVEECLPGEIVVSAAVTGDRGIPVGAVHVAGSMSEWVPDEFEKKIAPTVVAAARALSRG